MGSQAELLEILNHLLAVENDGDPTITDIQAVVPNLARMGWINRFAPQAWAQIATGLRTRELECLAKMLIVAEREYDWSGGSVAAPIWLFRAYEERADADTDALADWALRNRGRNNYIPFGHMTSARSLNDWHIEEQLRHERYRRHCERQREQQEAKAGRAREAAERNLQRRNASQAHFQTLEVRVEMLRHLGAHG